MKLETAALLAVPFLFNLDEALLAGSPDAPVKSLESGLAAGAPKQLAHGLGSAGPAADLALRRHPNLAHGVPAGARLLGHGGVAIDQVNAFNGNLLLSIPLGFDYPLSEHRSYQLALRYESNVWDYDLSAGDVAAVPNAQSNAGFGWSLSFGSLLAPGDPGNSSGRWLFVDMTGAAHSFYSTLYDGVPDADPGNDFFYTRDGSFLRLATVGSGAAVEFPNATRITFEAVVGAWRPSEVDFGSGNLLTIGYQPDGSWLLSDSHGRSHQVTFETDPTGTYPALVSAVTVEAPHGQQATYSLVYDVGTAQSCYDTSAATPSTRSVPLLSRIVQPDGTEYQLAYHPLTTGCGSAARAARMDLPTGGAVTWDYRTYRLPRLDCSLASENFRTKLRGVFHRTLIDETGQALRPTTLTQGVTGVDDTCSGVTQRSTTNYKTPLGDLRQLYFNVTDDDSYGLPYRPETTGTVSGHTVYHAGRLLDCDELGANCIYTAQDWVRFEQEGGCAGDRTDCAETHRRLIVKREQTGSYYRDRVYSDYDGLGHFRVVETGGNYGRTDVRTFARDYNPEAGVFPGSFAMPSTSQPWQLTDYASDLVEDDTGARLTEYCFDQATGNLLRQRIRADSNVRTARDVLIVKTFSGGSTTNIRHYGGDVQAVSTGASLCTLGLPSAPQYEEAKTWAFGALATHRFLGASSVPMPFFNSEVTRDAGTGLALVSKDVTGLATTYTYGAMGRELSADTATGPQVERGYTAALGTTPASMTTTTYAADGQTVLEARVTEQDAFGRLVAKKQLLPSGSWSRKSYRYDEMDHLTGVSSAELDGATPAWAESLDFDALDRPLLERRPDGGETTIAYTADRTTVRQELRGAYHVTNGPVYETDFTETLVYDGAGRLWKKTRDHKHWTYPSSASTTRVLEYVYDVAGNLVETHLDGVIDSPQRTWDGRGFLLSEVSFGPLETTTFDSYDARGLSRKDHSPDGELHYVYDRAGRLAEITDASDPATKWLEITYGTANQAGSRELGKPVVRTRTNRYPFNTGFVGNLLQVSETLSYGNPAGALSARETVIGDLYFERYRFSESFEADELGQTTRRETPRCESCSATDRAPDIAIRLGNTQGELTSLQVETAALTGGLWNVVSSVDHFPSGLEKTVSFANGVVEEFGTDFFGDRPTSAKLRKGSNTLAPLETLEYDSAGRFVRQGTEKYAVPLSGEQIDPESLTVSSLPEACFADPFGNPLSSDYEPDCSGTYRTMLAYNADHRSAFSSTLTGVLDRQFLFYDQKGATVAEVRRGQRPGSSGEKWLRDTVYLRAGNRSYGQAKQAYDAYFTGENHHPFLPKTAFNGSVILASRTDGGSLEALFAPMGDEEDCNVQGVPCPWTTFLNGVSSCAYATQESTERDCKDYPNGLREDLDWGACRADCTACCNAYAYDMAVQTAEECRLHLAEYLGVFSHLLHLIFLYCEVGDPNTFLPYIDAEADRAAACRTVCDRTYRDDDCEPTENAIAVNGTPKGGPPIPADPKCVIWVADEGFQGSGSSEWRCTQQLGQPMRNPAVSGCSVLELCVSPTSTNLSRAYACWVEDRYQPPGRPPEREPYTDDPRGPEGRGGGGGFPPVHAPPGRVTCSPFPCDDP